MERTIPHHDHSATDDRRSALGGVHRNSAGFGTNTETQNEPRHEKMLPRIGYTLPDTSGERDEGSDENGTTTTEIFVQRCCQPTTDNATAELIEMKHQYEMM